MKDRVLGQCRRADNETDRFKKKLDLGSRKNATSGAMWTNEKSKHLAMACCVWRYRSTKKPEKSNLFSPPFAKTLTTVYNVLSGRSATESGRSRTDVVSVQPRTLTRTHAPSRFCVAMSGHFECRLRYRAWRHRLCCNGSYIKVGYLFGWGSTTNCFLGYRLERAKQARKTRIKHDAVKISSKNDRYAISRCPGAW